MRGLGQLLGGPLDALQIVAVLDLFQGFDLGFNIGLGRRIQLIGTKVLHGFFRLVDHGIGGVLGLDQFFLPLVVFGVGLGVLDQPVDLFLGEPAGSGDLDGLLLAGTQILGGDIDDAVGVDVKGHFDLGHAPGRRRDIGQLKPAQGLVAFGHLPLALENVDGHRRLVVGGRGKDLALLGRDGGVFLDQPGHDAAQGLNAQGEGGDVQQQDIVDVPLEHAGLNGRAHGHHFVRVDALVGLFAEDLLDPFLNRGHAGHAAHQNHLVDLAGGETRILQGRLTGAGHPVQKIGYQLFQFGPGQLDVEVLGPACVGGDKGQIDLRLQGRGQLHFGFLSRFLKPLQRHFIVAQVDALILLELVGQVIHHPQVEVFAAQVSVAVGGLDFKDPVAQFQDGNIKRSAAQVKDGDLLVFFLVQAVGQGRGRRFVDDALDV